MGAQRLPGQRIWLKCVARGTSSSPEVTCPEALGSASWESNLGKRKRGSGWGKNEQLQMASTSPKHAINFQTGYLQPVRQSLLGVGSMQCGNGQGSRRQGQEWQSKLVSGLCEAETQRHGCCHCSVTQSCLTL